MFTRRSILKSLAAILFAPIARLFASQKVYGKSPLEPAREVTAWLVDYDKATMTPLYSDGKTGQPTQLAAWESPFRDFDRWHGQKCIDYWKTNGMRSDIVGIIKHELTLVSTAGCPDRVGILIRPDGSIAVIEPPQSTWDNRQPHIKGDIRREIERAYQEVGWTPKEE